MTNKTFRLFISSTFSDFLEERSILNGDIYNAVSDYCKKRGYNFQMIDLRWGVNTESALNQKTLEICIGEVMRCRRLSPKPNFLLMVGERYGWIPLPYSVEAEEFSAIYDTCGASGQAVLDKWYRRDENDLEEKYTLLPRTGKFTDDFTWAKTEAELREILIRGARQCAFSDDKLLKYTTSATEHEIIEGFLGNEELNKNTVALFRNHFSAPAEDYDKVMALRDVIKSKMESEGNLQNLIELDYDGLDYSELFRKYITELLIKNIDEEIERLAHQNDAGEFADYDNRSYLSAYTGSYFYRREDELRVLNEYVSGESNKPFYVFGPSGSGKTMLLANFLNNLQCFFVYSFYGMNDLSYTLPDAIAGICRALRRRFSMMSDRSINKFNMAEEFWDTIKLIPENEKVVIVIDGLDTFYESEDIVENIFPLELPNKVKLILSSTNKEAVKGLSDSTSNTMYLDSFDSPNSIVLFDELMLRQGRRLSDAAQREVFMLAVKNGCTPLQLKLMTIVCKDWHSYDSAESIPNTAHKIALSHIQSMYQKYGHDKELVINALSIIAAAPYGITEEELQLLLFRIPSVRSSFNSEDRYGYSLDKLPFVVWSRLFYDLEDCLTLMSTGNYPVLKFTHNIFYSVVNSEFSGYVQNAENILVDYYNSIPVYADSKKFIPYPRKMANLIALYRKKHNLSGLCRLMSDTASADAALKSMDINEVIGVYSEAVQYMRRKNSAAQAEGILECITSNYNILSCYSGEFYQCAAASGIAVNEKPVLEWHREISNNSESFSLPYNPNSEITWSPKGTRFAVYNESYIYICDSETKRELGRIYRRASLEWYIGLSQVLWLNENDFIVIRDKRIYRYIVDGNNIIHTQTYNPISGADVIDAYYSDIYRILLVCGYKKIVALDIQSGEIVYSIIADSSARFSSCTVNSDKKSFSVTCKKNVVRVYDMLTGNYITRYTLRPSLIHYIGLEKAYRINSDKWLVSVDEGILIFDTAKSRRRYIIPPYNSDSRSVYIFENYLICKYDNMLVCVDLLDGYKMSMFSCKNIINISYIPYSNALAISGPHRINIVKIGDFTPLKGRCKSCMLSRRNTKSSLLTYLFDHMMNFDTDFIDMDEFLSEKRYINGATHIETAPDGKLAVVYEEMDTIKIFDSDGKEILIFDKLNLNFNVSNSILEIRFSENSEYIYIWRNFSLKAVNLQSGKCVLDFNMTYRNASDVRFTSHNSIKVTFYDNTSHEFELEGKNRCKIPSRIMPENRCDGPYSRYRNCTGMASMPLLHRDWRHTEDNDSSSKWFRDERAYLSEKYLLTYRNSHFFLEDITSQLFRDDFYNFSVSLQQELAKDQNDTKTFIREKNDLMSKTLEVEDRFIILVTRRINSVIVFDRGEMKVIAAYKHYGQIIGVNYYKDSMTLELFSDERPYRFKIKLNLANA